MPLVDIELWDGTHTWCHGYREGLPWWRWGGAPRGLCTRSQVHAAGRRLARGQDPCGLIVWRRGKRTAVLYRLDLTRPSRRKTPALMAAVEVMERGRRTCRDCGETRDYRMPTSTKTCWTCMETTDENSDSVGQAIAKARNAVKEITAEQAAGEEWADEDDRTDELARWHADDGAADVESAQLAADL